VIRDGDIVLIESGAIVEYIIQRYAGGKLAIPVESPDYARYLQWMHFAEGSAMTQLLLHMFLGGFIPGVDQASPWVARTKERTTGLLQYLDSELSARPYFAGQDFTAADLMMMFPLFLRRTSSRWICRPTRISAATSSASKAVPPIKRRWRSRIHLPDGRSNRGGANRHMIAD